MIGNFARLFRAEPPTPARARTMDEELAEAKGEPPERFVDKISDEGGDVYVAPMLETLRAALRRHLHPSKPDPEEGTTPSPARDA